MPKIRAKRPTMATTAQRDMAMAMTAARKPGRWRGRLACAVALVALFAAAAAARAAEAEKRLALVIGNARYPEIALNNPENDARVVASTLRRLGFDVSERVNLGVIEFRRVLRDFVRRLQDQDGVAVFYYAGHAVQIAGRNYLLPIDINLRDEEEVRDDAVDIDEVFVSRLEHARSRVRIVILDACRDDPYATTRDRAPPRGLTRGGGLAEMSASGALIAYSSAPGQAAEDGPPGTNSVYTRNLVKEMLAEDVEVEKMFKSVRVDVLRETGERQVPWVNSSLTVDFSFNPTRRAGASDRSRLDEIAALKAKLEERERMQRDLEERLRQATATPAAASTAPAPLDAGAPSARVASPATHAPDPAAAGSATPAAERPWSATKLAGAGVLLPATAQTPSERCVALIIRAQLGEPVSASDVAYMQRTCRSGATSRAPDVSEALTASAAAPAAPRVATPAPRVSDDASSDAKQPGRPRSESARAEVLPPDGAQAFDDAVKSAIDALLAGTELDAALAARGVTGAVALVVDPLIDASTGFQTRATRTLEDRALRAAHQARPRLEPAAFDLETLAGKPLLLVGTMTPLDRDDRTDGVRAAYGIRLALLDLRRGRVVSRSSARARLDGVDATPTPFFAQMPAWVPDPAVEAYVRACADGAAGAPIDAAYRDGIEAAALVAQGIREIEAGRPREAIEDLVRARSRPGASSFRVDSGIYLSSVRMDRRGDTAQSFARIVDFGLTRGRLGIRFLFRPGATQLAADAATAPSSSASYAVPYALWLGLVAQRAEARRGCIRISGHTTRSGPESLGDRLSLQRAQAVKNAIDAVDPEIASRTFAVGRGFHDSLSGLGTDDVRDSIDQRIEFAMHDCPKNP